MVSAEQWKQFAEEARKDTLPSHVGPKAEDCLEVAALIGAVRSALALLEYDRNALFESNRQPSTNEVTDPDARAELVEYDSVIKAFRALLPPVGETGVAAESETQHADRACVTLKQLKEAWSAADWARAGSGSGTKGMTEEQITANEEVRDDAWCHALAELLGLRVVGQGETATDHANVEPIYKAVERVLDEESGWIARPNHEVTKRIALAAGIAAHQNLSVEVERMQDALERERSQVATGIGAVKEAIRKREWLRLGRGSFEWDDERWKDEFGHAIDEILQAMEPLRSIACDWSDCPTDWERIKRARATPTAISDGERDSIDSFLSDVRREFEWGRKKFPGREIKGLACAEEFGEMIKAMLDEPAANVRKEAIQLAATALRIVVDGDSSVDDFRELRGLDLLSKREDGG